MVMFKLLEVGTQPLALPSSRKDFIKLFDEIGCLLSQVYQDRSKSIQNALMPIKGVLFLNMIINQANFDVQISLASYLIEFIRITAPNLPFR